MRTTTKRGLGRTATLNGHENGNGRAVLPPAALQPMRRYRQPPPPPRSRLKTAGKVFGWLLLVLLVVVSGLAGGLYLYVHETVDALGAHSTGAIKTSKDKNLRPIASPTQPATALIIGYDTRQGADAKLGQQSRSDTIMLVRADPTNKTLSLFSFPRDLVVSLYCNGSNVPYAADPQDRINAAWAHCGEEGTLDTVAHLTNIPISYVITVDFHGFKLLVNKLHGVYMDVDHRYYIPPNSGTSAIDLEPGYQKLDGGDALAFVRFRHTDSDLYRNARQQLFIDALKNRLASGFSLTDIPGLIGAIKGSVEIAQPGGGAPSLSVIQSYVGLGYHLPPGHLFRVNIQNTTFCGYLNAEVCTTPADVQAAVNSFLHPDVTVSTRANDQALGVKPKTRKPKTVKPSAITTLVLNGTNITGLAGNTSYELAKAGFHTVQLPPTQYANAPSSDYYGNVVYYDSVQANAKSAARTLAQAMGPHTATAPLSPEIAPLAQQAGNPLTVVVVGSAFGGTVTNPAANVQPTPPPTPAQVYSTDTSSTIRAANVHMPFTIMAPRVLASGSTWTTMEPIRGFKPVPGQPGTKELALTFVTAAGNVYYQVVETNWLTAPILRGSTGTLHDRKSGRTFQLFTTSGNIHMIAFRKGNATYWVFNTLRDELTNATMVALARGLQPLGK